MREVPLQVMQRANPLSSKLGTSKTVRTRLCPWLQDSQDQIMALGLQVKFLESC